MYNLKIQCGRRSSGGALKSRADSTGFTLIEVLMALVIAAVLANLAIPGFQTLIQDVKLTGEQNRFVKTLRSARSEAIKRGRQVTVCARQNNSKCVTNGTDWSGWLVFEELSTGTPGTIDTGEPVIAIYTNTTDGVSISTSALIRPATSASNQLWVSFSPRGRSNWTQGTVTLCDHRGAADALALVINGAGALRNVKSDSGAPKNAQGVAVTCP